MDYTLLNAEDFAADESFNAYYLKKDAAAVAFWENWISLHPEKMDEVYNAEQILATLYLRLGDEDLQMAFSKFDDFLQTDAANTTLDMPERPSFLNIRMLRSVGAVAVLLIIGFFFVKFNMTEKPLAYVTYHNDFGKITQLTLSDGTMVTLNANSSLKYPKSFAAKKREVILDGEAFFDVSKDRARPFSVNAKGTRTTVLGTKFNISAYPAGKNTVIALVEGKVLAEANRGKEKLLLKPSEMATFNGTSRHLIKSSFDIAAITGWKSGMLIFKEASFEEIAARFYNVYGVHLVDHTKNTRWSFSAQFDKADYITVIKSICFSKHLKFKQTQNTIILTQ